MSSCSNYLEKKILDHVCKVAAYTQPTNLYLGLFKGSPAANLEAGTLTDEQSGSGYARQLITFNAADSVTGVITNSAIVTFPVATASWGTITYCAILDASTGGNVLFYGPLTASKTVDLGDAFQIGASNLTITLA